MTDNSTIELLMCKNDRMSADDVNIALFISVSLTFHSVLHGQISIDYKLISYNIFVKDKRWVRLNSLVFGTCRTHVQLYEGNSDIVYSGRSHNEIMSLLNCIASRILSTGWMRRSVYSPNEPIQEMPMKATDCVTWFYSVCEFVRQFQLHCIHSR